jgi:uncharacterized membrane protein YkvA (DUF1232 family)
MKFLLQPLYNLYRQILRNPKYRWIVIGASLLYLVSPIDLATDAIPVIGWLDDGVIVSLLVAELSQFVMEQRQSRKEKNATEETATVDA